MALVQVMREKYIYFSMKTMKKTTVPQHGMTTLPSLYAYPPEHERKRSLTKLSQDYYETNKNTSSKVREMSRSGKQARVKLI